MPKIVDLKGKIFGRLTVISLAERPPHVKTPHRFWLCRCECGKEKIIAAAGLKEGTQSCGCFHREAAGARMRLPAGQAGFNKLFTSYKHGAKSRNLEFHLTKETFGDITSSLCHYCGASPFSVSRYRVGRMTEAGVKNARYIYNGVDRKNAQDHYTEENCVPCCSRCNFAKGVMGYDEFYSWIDDIIKHSNDVLAVDIFMESDGSISLEHHRNQRLKPKITERDCVVDK